MAKRILVCGLPGSGKTTLAAMLADHMKVPHINGDDVRKAADDWDFTAIGRNRQAERMRKAADAASRGIVIADFVCPTEATRRTFDADVTVFLDTVDTSRHPDTDAIFQKPVDPDARIERFLTLQEVEYTAESLRFLVPQGTMIGRFQPWHAGHRALFERVQEREGYVGIGVRVMPAGSSNPFDFPQVKERIEADLGEYTGLFNVFPMPNVSGIYYGRDVGYNIEQIKLPADIEAISATAIRKRGDL